VKRNSYPSRDTAKVLREVVDMTIPLPICIKRRFSPVKDLISLCVLRIAYCVGRISINGEVAATYSCRENESVLPFLKVSERQQSRIN
jgi:hypothetical protein